MVIKPLTASCGIFLQQFSSIQRLIFANYRMNHYCKMIQTSPSVRDIRQFYWRASK
jgi:hypothetical protein